MQRDPFIAPFMPEAADLQAAAWNSRTRARHVRKMAFDLPAGLQPLGVAMRRRACELELADVALSAIADGRRGQDVDVMT